MSILRRCFFRWRKFLCWLFYRLVDKSWEQRYNPDKRSKWVKFLEYMGITNKSFCYHCGRSIRLDFAVSNELWAEIMGDSKKVSCYDCFTEKALKLNKCPTYWKLEYPEEEGK